MLISQMWEAIIVSVVVSSEGLQEDQAKVVAAARAAASWARARRSTWTNAPLPLVETVQASAAPAASVLAPAATVLAASIPVAPPVPVVSKPAGPSAATRALDALRPVLRWVPRLAFAAALVVGAVVGYPYAVKMLPSVLKMLPSGTKAPETAGPKGPIDPNAAKPTTATLTIASTPPSAQVLLDGKPRGITPTTLRDVAPGKHTVELKHKDGNITRTITVAAGDTETIDEQIFAGWVAIISPFEVTVSEGDRALRPDDRSQVMLPPGRHELRLVNRSLGYESVQKVDVKPGEVARLDVAPARSTLTVTANDPAEVFLDGTKIGDTPLNAFTLDLGTHEVLVKRIGGSGERRYTVTAMAKPTTIAVDFAVR